MDQRTTRGRSPGLPFPTRRHALPTAPTSLVYDLIGKTKIAFQRTDPARKADQRGSILYSENRSRIFREFGGYKGYMNSLIVPPIRVEQFNSHEGSTNTIRPK
jgi:hypothetical protein